MKQIKYNFESTLRFEYPPEWDITNLTAISCEVRDTGGTVLQAAADATLYAGDTLASAASSGSNTITLTTGTALKQGDRIRIGGAITEDRTVLSYIASSKTVTLDNILDYDHTINGTVEGLFATVSLDTTTVATFPANKQMVIGWTPTGIGEAEYTELAEIAKANAFSAADFDEEFRSLFPREYETCRDRLDTLQRLGERRLGYDLQRRGCNMERVVDQNILMDSLLALVRFLAIQDNDDEWEREIQLAKDEYSKLFEELVSAPFWVDEDQDQAQDDNEFQDYGAMLFERGL